MTPLHEQLHESYGAHPSFQFDQAPFAVDAALVDAFDEAYALMPTYGTHLGAAQIRAQGERCERLLSQIFGALEQQATDPHERRFVHELTTESARLLQGEVAHYVERAKRRGVTLGGTAAGGQALALARDAHYFGRLSTPAVQAIRAAAEAELREFRAKAAAGRVTREDLSINAGPTVRRIARLLNADLRAGGTLDAVSAYMGRPMSVGGLALELSVPNATWWSNAYEGLERPPHTLYAHVDESIQFPKAIVYLSNVDADTGPTGCYPHAFRDLALRPIQEIVGRVIANVGAAGSPLSDLYRKRYHQSMSSEPFRRHFMRLPPALRFNSHFGWDVRPGSELETALVRRERVMTGPAGTFIVFDGAKLLHRGGMVRRDERVALQVIFSNAPTVRSRLVGQIKKRLA